MCRGVKCGHGSTELPIVLKELIEIVCPAKYLAQIDVHGFIQCPDILANVARADQELS